MATVLRGLCSRAVKNSEKYHSFYADLSDTAFLGLQRTTAKADAAAVVLEEILQLKLKVIPHPSYSPDLVLFSPCEENSACADI